MEVLRGWRSLEEGKEGRVRLLVQLLLWPEEDQRRVMFHFSQLQCFNDLRGSGFGACPPYFGAIKSHRARGYSLA